MAPMMLRGLRISWATPAAGADGGQLFLANHHILDAFEIGQGLTQIVGGAPQGAFHRLGLGDVVEKKDKRAARAFRDGIEPRLHLPVGQEPGGGQIDGPDGRVGALA